MHMREEYDSKYDNLSDRSLKYYLGVKFERFGNKTLLTQDLYNELVLDKFGMNNVNAAPMPMSDIFDNLANTSPNDDEREELQRVP